MVYNDPRPDGRTNYRYIYPQEIINYFKRREIEQIPKEILDRRANVEATIHQVFCKMSKKSRYRGLLSNHYMTLGRCFWTNCTRITQFLQKEALLQKQTLNQLLLALYASLSFSRKLSENIKPVSPFLDRFVILPKYYSVMSRNFLFV